MIKYKKGDRVGFLHKEKFLKGTILGGYQSLDDELEYDILTDTNELLAVHEDDLLTKYKKNVVGRKYKYVLKSMLLDEVFPKDHDKYVKVKVIKT